MRRLHKILMILTATAALTPALARAQGVAHDSSSSATIVGAASAHRGFGVGVEGVYWPGAYGGGYNPNGVAPNMLVTWGDSAGRFHVDGLFGFLNHNTSNFDVGIRGWYHLHATPHSDLSAGGGITLISWKNPGPGQSRQTDFQMELGAQIRAFFVSNVAFLGSVGMNMYFPDSGDSTFIISGNLVGAIGLAYYFQ